MTEKNAMRVPKDQRDNIVSTKAHDITKRREWKTLRIMEEEHAERVATEEAKKSRLDEFRDVVQVAFNKYDEDGSGTMEIDELEQMLKHELREPVPPEDLQAAIQEILSFRNEHSDEACPTLLSWAWCEGTRQAPISSCV